MHRREASALHCWCMQIIIQLYGPHCSSITHTNWIMIRHYFHLFLNVYRKSAIIFIIYSTRQMGYAMPTQISSGIHFRQYSRAFIMADSLNKTSVVFINADVCMGSQIMKMQVIKRLQALYGDRYSDSNVLISGIHTHSGPAGYFQYVLFEVRRLDSNYRSHCKIII